MKHPFEAMRSPREDKDKVILEGVQDYDLEQDGFPSEDVRIARYCETIFGGSSSEKVHALLHNDRLIVEIERFLLGSEETLFLRNIFTTLYNEEFLYFLHGDAQAKRNFEKLFRIIFEEEFNDWFGEDTDFVRQFGFLYTFLEKRIPGLDIETLRRDWDSQNPVLNEGRASLDEREYRSIRVLDIKRILELENDDTGSVSWLQKNRNIAFFGAYSKEFLLDNKKYDDDGSTSHGFIFISKGDHNGANYSGRFSFPFESLYKGLSKERKEGLDAFNDKEPGFHLRLYEFYDEVDLIKKTGAIYKNISKGRWKKGELFIIAAHGTGNAMVFAHPSDSSEKFVHTQEFIERSSVISRIKGRVLEEDAGVVLHSCSVGADDGLAEQVGRVCNMDIIGPKTSLNEMIFSEAQNGEGILDRINWYDYDKNTQKRLAVPKGGYIKNENSI